MKKYTKKEYQKYCQQIRSSAKIQAKKTGRSYWLKMKPVSFEEWKKEQPIADKLCG